MRKSRTSSGWPCESTPHRHCTNSVMSHEILVGLAMVRLCDHVLVRALQTCATGQSQNVSWQSSGSWVNRRRLKLSIGPFNVSSIHCFQPDVLPVDILVNRVLLGYLNKLLTAASTASAWRSTTCSMTTSSLSLCWSLLHTSLLGFRLPLRANSINLPVSQNIYNSISSEKYIKDILFPQGILE